MENLNLTELKEAELREIEGGFILFLFYALCTADRPSDADLVTGYDCWC